MFLLFHRGGNPPAPPVQGGVRAMHAFWMGGAGAAPGAPATTDRSPDAYYKPEREQYRRLKRLYYQQLQAELDRQLEAEAEAIQAREAPQPQPKRKRRRRKANRTHGSEMTAPLMDGAPRVQVEVAKLLANQPVISSDARARREALEAYLDAIAQHLAMQDEEDAIFMLLMG